jgi:AcrR family transcriptional regulator
VTAWFRQAAFAYRARVENRPAYAREPKQERSRASFERAVDAAVALLVERRSDAFTLAEVAERGGVSIGSIYGRVDSKDDLLRAAHAREMARIAAEQHRVFAAPAPVGESLGATVGRVLAATAAVLRDNASVMAPFMLLSNSDPVVAELGRLTHGDLQDAFTAALLERREQIPHPDPERAVAWSFTVVYSVLARWLGLGSDLASAGEGEWSEVLAALTDMVTAFLARPVPKSEA